MAWYFGKAELDKAAVRLDNIFWSTGGKSRRMTLLEKIFYLFGRNTDSYSVKGYQAQFKPTINDIGVNLSHNNEAPRISANTFDIIVVGVSFNQEALEKICDSRRVEGAEMFVQAK